MNNNIKENIKEFVGGAWFLTKYEVEQLAKENGVTVATIKRYISDLHIPVRS